MPLSTDILAMTSLSNPIASLVTAMNVLVAGGFSIPGLVSPKSAGTPTEAQSYLQCTPRPAAFP
jgi:hypothetical protein